MTCNQWWKQHWCVSRFLKSNSPWCLCAFCLCCVGSINPADTRTQQPGSVGDKKQQKSDQIRSTSCSIKADVWIHWDVSSATRCSVPVIWSRCGALGNKFGLSICFMSNLWFNSNRYHFSMFWTRTYNFCDLMSSRTLQLHTCGLFLIDKIKYTTEPEFIIHEI